MTALAEPTARRLRRPSWRDPRLLIGVAMVLLATALGAMGLRAADSRCPSMPPALFCCPANSSASTNSSRRCATLRSPHQLFRGR